MNAPFREATGKGILGGVLGRLVRHVLDDFFPCHRNRLDLFGIEVHLFQVDHSDTAVVERAEMVTEVLQV
jgi:hypothetical protein